MSENTNPMIDFSDLVRTIQSFIAECREKMEEIETRMKQYLDGEVTDSRFYEEITEQINDEIQPLKLQIEAYQKVLNYLDNY